MKTAKKRRSSRDPGTSCKKRSEAVARDLEALEQENVVEEEVPTPPIHDEIKTEQGALLFYLYKCPRATKIQESIISASKSA